MYIHIFFSYMFHLTVTAFLRKTVDTRKNYPKCVAEVIIIIIIIII